MNLRSIDLNLLLVFDTIYRERNISRAASKLALSQPTVSNALARLRERLDDPLFTRTPDGMVPTARAKTLADPIRQALDLIERGIRSDDAFDHAHSERCFVIAVEDYGETVILPRFSDWLAQTAPNIRLKIRPEPGGQLGAAMKDGRVDLTLDYFVQHDPSFHNECVLTDSLLTLSRRDHPQLSGRLTLEAYLAQRHVALTPRAGSMSMIDLALAKRGLRRHIALEVPHFQSMPVLVQNTGLLCTVPKRMAHLYADNFGLTTHTVPLRVPSFPIYLTWHSSTDADSAHRWLRENLITLCQRL
ncbi:HTH-type transcriptional regulator LeuO [Paraburkholderia domus]|uniref:LysR family transcriptional regulator n=1 Tax=Paraburkholderia domus TaxID=2793075 RepID=UPI0019130EAA|nr:LysR family transcriptional regulator [Paraburkholderia domus]MBK5050468.1 LysR family transcriptional regulator [Burkholderia sp. R-70006]CAE6754430.1 HTH-type transcriptional regulator LeuO [Paraburkholderia domus]